MGTTGADAASSGGCHGAVVLGMGRSGTSAITRSLVCAGFYAGADAELMEPSRGNPLGYYENLGIYAMNEGILARTGATWFAPPSPEAQRDASADARALLRDALARLRRDGGGAPLAIKDPRIGVLLEIWGPLIDGALHPVLAVRNPVEIALSLATRDGTPTALTLASWELHMARVLAYLHDRDVTVAPYAWLVGSREAASRLVESVTLELDDEYALRVEPARAALAVEPGLYRNRTTVDALADHLTGHQRDLWSYLSSLAAGTQRLTVPEGLTREDAHVHDLARAESHRVATERRARDLAHELEHQRERTAEAEAALARDRDRLAAAEQARDEARLAQQRAEHWLAELQASASWRLTAPPRALAQFLRRRRARIPRPPDRRPSGGDA